jgi:hypothetical protein
MNVTRSRGDVISIRNIGDVRHNKAFLLLSYISERLLVSVRYLVENWVEMCHNIGRIDMKKFIRYFLYTDAIHGYVFDDECQICISPLSPVSGDDGMYVFHPVDTYVVRRVHEYSSPHYGLKAPVVVWCTDHNADPLVGPCRNGVFVYHFARRDEHSHSWLLTTEFVSAFSVPTSRGVETIRMSNVDISICIVALRLARELSKTDDVLVVECLDCLFRPVDLWYSASSKEMSYVIAIINYMLVNLRYPGMNVVTSWKSFCTDIFCADVNSLWEMYPGIHVVNTNLCALYPEAEYV